jgi:hypothetical protein
MPIDSLLVATSVCIVFLFFAFVVAWADHTTTRWLSSKQAATVPDAATRQPSQKAA